MDTARVTSPRTLRLDIESPGDKSIGHRSLILNAAAEGEATVTRFPRGADTLATLAIVRALGVRVTELARSDDGHSSTLRVRSNGVHGLKEPNRVLNARNSGTTMRLMLGLLAAAPLTAVMVGDGSLRQRPMGRVVEPLRAMGRADLGPTRWRARPPHRSRYRSDGFHLRNARRQRPTQIRASHRRCIRVRQDHSHRTRPLPRPHGAHDVRHGRENPQRGRPNRNRTI